MRFHRRALLLLAACAALIGGASVLSAQTVGSIRGKVVEGNTLKPLSGVQVTVPGTGRGALSDAAGNYLINNVPAGQRTVRAEMLGYNVVDRPLAVVVSQTVVQDFQLAQVAIAMNELVVTGVPGATSKRTLGNSITKLNAADLTEKTVVTNVAELLQSKTPGLVLLPNSNVAGAAPDIRIRGAGSLSVSNTPMVYVDGVRYNTGGYGSFVPSGAGNVNYRGQTTSALDGIDPNDIESIEVIKGPAAATLYGPEAAAGVIQVITKKGKIGQQALQWSGKFEYGGNDLGSVTIPPNYTTCDQAKLAVPLTWPGCVGKTPGTQLIWNPLRDDPAALRTGPVQRVQLTAKGGGDNFSYYIAGDLDNQNGVFYNSASKRKSVRANFTMNPSNNIDFNVTTNYARGNIRFPLGDESAEGMLLSAFRGQPGHSPPGGVAIRQGWGSTAAVEANAYNNTTVSDRLTIGSTLNYRPFQWFRHKMTVGMDYTGSVAQVISAPGSVDADYAGYSQGLVAQRAPRQYYYTLDYAGNADKRFGESLLATTSVGAQYTYSRYESLYGWGYGLGAPDVTLLQTAQQNYSSQSFTESKSLGFFGQEQLGWKDRLYVTGALRLDNSSQFGENVHRYLYPKASLSWVASDEPALKPFFDMAHFDNFKFRTAWGRAGRAPTPYAWSQTYSVAKVIQGTTVGSALRTQAVGNPDLKPEKGQEVEVGFESGLLGDRAGIDFTYYRKDMTDVLIAASVAPSSGFASTLWYSNGSQWQNLGKTRNEGVELALRGTPVLSRHFTWDAAVTLATNRNRLVSFGDTLRKTMSISGQSYGTVQKHQPGYPLAGYWATMPKRNADGSLVLNAAGVALPTDTAVYIGPSSPTRNMSFSNTFTFLRNIRLFALVDYAGGFYNFNSKEGARCRSQQNCAQMNDPNNVDLTNMDWTGAYGPKATPKNPDVAIWRSSIYGPWIQPGDFIKFRDLSVTYNVPIRLLPHTGIRSLALTGAAHNLGILWTRYGGIDPEVNSYGDVSFSRADVYPLPMVRRYSVSANVSF